jgi:hypothetical protein
MIPTPNNKAINEFFQLSNTPSPKSEEWEMESYRKVAFFKINYAPRTDVKYCNISLSMNHSAHTMLQNFGEGKEDQRFHMC